MTDKLEIFPDFIRWIFLRFPVGEVGRKSECFLRLRVNIICIAG